MTSAPRAHKVGDFGAGGSSAIDRDEELRSICSPAALDPFAAQAIAFLHPRRQKERGRGSISGQHLVQESERGHPIHIVVAVKYDPLAPINRAEDALDCDRHVGEKERVAQIAQTRAEKIERLTIVQQSFSMQEAGDAGEAANAFGKRRRGCR
jgi:hypothetical protein